MRLLVGAAGALLIAGCASAPAPLPPPPTSAAAIAAGTAAGCLKFERSQVPSCIGDAVLARHQLAAANCASVVLRQDYKVENGLAQCVRAYDH